MKRIIRLTESDLVRVVNMVISEQSYVDTKKNKIISVNSSNVTKLKKKYLSNDEINGSIRDIIISAADKFLKKVNSTVDKTTNEMTNSDGNETATFYLDSIKKAIYETVNDISWAKKVLLTKLMSKEEFKKLMDWNTNTINDLLRTLTINTFLEIHEPTKVNEAKWYDKAYNAASKRVDQIEAHLIDWIIKQFYG